MAQALVVKVLLAEACDENDVLGRLTHLLSSPSVRTWQMERLGEQHCGLGGEAGVPTPGREAAEAAT
jgi:hypothetical protein